MVSLACAHEVGARHVLTLVCSCVEFVQVEYRVRPDVVGNGYSVPATARNLVADNDEEDGGAALSEEAVRSLSMYGPEADVIANATRVMRTVHTQSINLKP